MSPRSHRQLTADVCELLHGRGIVAPIEVLGRRSSVALVGLETWVLRRGRFEQRPEALTTMLESREAVLLAGVCRECGCTEDFACPQGCAWADDTKTLCTACVP